MKRVIVVEGLDRMGKDTLIEGIEQRLGYFQHIHFSKPKKLKAYDGISAIDGIPRGQEAIYTYQYQSFLNAMLMIVGGARLIFNRSWIGEAVYSPMYRGIDGSYVFDLERKFNLESMDILLILLTEDFEVAKHFVDDGESLGPIEKRKEEQNRFIAAFNRSNIKDKRVICVTDLGTGGFRHKEDILVEALEGL